VRVLVVVDEVRNAELTALELRDAGHETGFVNGGAASRGATTVSGWAPEFPPEGSRSRCWSGSGSSRRSIARGGNGSQAARLPGLTRRTLYSRLECHGLRKPGEGTEPADHEGGAPPGAGEERG
jgi:hypothetical protein